MLNVCNCTVGAVVDGVSDVIDLPANAVRPVPAMRGADEARFITGIGTLQAGERQRMLILLDVEALMSSAELGLTGTADMAAVQ